MSPRPPVHRASPRDVAFREQLDLDSMDVLNFVIALHAARGVEIPEADYPKLATLDGCVDYVLSAPWSAGGPTTA